MQNRGRVAAITQAVPPAEFIAGLLDILFVFLYDSKAAKPHTGEVSTWFFGKARTSAAVYIP